MCFVGAPDSVQGGAEQADFQRVLDDLVDLVFVEVLHFLRSGWRDVLDELQGELPSPTLKILRPRRSSMPSGMTNCGNSLLLAAYAFLLRRFFTFDSTSMDEPPSSILRFCCWYSSAVRMRSCCNSNEPSASSCNFLNFAMEDFLYAAINWLDDI